MTAGIKANVDGSAAIQVGGVDAITLTSAGAASFVTSPMTIQGGSAAAPSLTFSGDTNTGIFSPAADTIAFSEGGVESMRIDASGNLLVGATSALGPAANRGNITVNGATDAILAFGNAASLAGYILQDSGGMTLFSSGATYQRFYTNNAERARIDSSGRFMVGTTGSSSAGINIGNQYGGVNLAGGGGSYANWGGGYGIWPWNNVGLGIGSAAAIGFVVNGGTDAARITAAGGFTCAGIYNTTVGATNRDVFVDNGGVVGYVSSLRASKTNIANLTDTSWLYQLNPVTFNYRKKDEEGNYTDETDGDIQYGMIAEDVEQVRPDLCFYDEVDGQQELRGIQYSKLVPVMLKALQELKAELDATKAEVALLKGAA